MPALKVQDLDLLVKINQHVGNVGDACRLAIEWMWVELRVDECLKYVCTHSTASSRNGKKRPQVIQSAFTISKSV